MLMDWDTTHRKFPWSLIFLIGGGFALAAGSTVKYTMMFPHCVWMLVHCGRLSSHN